MIAATRATPRTSPLRAPPSRTSANVAGNMRMRPVATATRAVMAFSPTSTMWAAPAASKWVSPLIDTPFGGRAGVPVGRLEPCRRLWAYVTYGYVQVACVHGSPMGTNRRRVYHTNASALGALPYRPPVAHVNRALFRAIALTVSMALTAPPIAAPAQTNELPALGEAGADDLSPANERKLGESIMREIYADPSYLPDPDTTEYLNKLGYQLVAAS